MQLNMLPLSKLSRSDRMRFSGLAQANAQPVGDGGKGTGRRGVYESAKTAGDNRT